MMGEKVMELERVKGDDKHKYDKIESEDEVEPVACTRDRVVPNQITTKHKPPPIPIPKVTSEIVDLSRSSAKRKRSSMIG